MPQEFIHMHKNVQYCLYNKIITTQYSKPFTIKCTPTFPISLPVPSFLHILQSSHIRLCTISSNCYVHSYCHIFTLSLFVTPIHPSRTRFKKVLSIKSSMISSLPEQKFIMLSSRLSYHIIQTPNHIILLFISSHC